jgi:prevent-host-death family protein
MMYIDVSRRHSIAEARSKLPQLIREAEEGKTVELTRRGEGVAVIIGLRQYERLASRPKRFSSAWEQFTSNADLSDLDIDPDEVFADVRDKRPGRNHRL